MRNIPSFKSRSLDVILLKASILCIVLCLITFGKLFSQRQEAKLIQNKRLALENIIATSTLLKIASNPAIDYKVEMRMQLHKSALSSYRVFKENYELIRGMLSLEINDQLKVVISSYDQICVSGKDDDFLTEARIVNKIANCEMRIDQIAEMMIK